MYKSVASVKNSKLNIPYTGIMHFDGLSVTSPVSGIYMGVDYYELSYSVIDITPHPS